MIAAKGHGIVPALPNEDQSAVLVGWLEKPKEEWVDGRTCVEPPAVRNRRDNCSGSVSGATHTPAKFAQPGKSS